MKDRTLILLASLVAGACCVLALAALAFNQRQRLNLLEARLERIESHKPRVIEPLRVWGAFSTTDQRPEGSSLLGAGSDTNASYSVFQPPAKSGPVIGPEFRIASDSTDQQTFDIAIDPAIHHVVQAWVTDTTPCDALASFEEFQVYASYNHTTVLRLVARAKPKASIKMRFRVMLLCEKEVQ